ncbi:MAG: S1 RNA-binding domain-containing protein [Bradymonadales bacterium]|nr:S1 RNA-binding domain-containing protein [Bradymonadales bacterium]
MTGEKPNDTPQAGQEEPDLDFGAMLDRTTRRGPIEQGEIVSGRLISISQDWAFVDLGGKTEGVLATRELKDPSGGQQYKVGDLVEAFVASIRGGEIQLSLSLGRQIKDENSLFECHQQGVPIEGRVTATNKGGFEISVFGGRRAFCPISQIDIAYTEDPSVHVGQTYEFKIVELSSDGKRIVLSRAALLRQERKERQEELREQLEEGAIFEGVVTSVQDYGAFVDLGGLEGLVHVSEMSWRRLEHPSEVVKQGDTVTVKVLGIKQTDKGQRISLSMREANPHPWIAVGTKFVEGETYRGTVTRLEPYGAFVELGPGVEGLIHVSEMSWERRIKHASEILSLGEPVDAYIKSIDYDKQRIALSLKALKKDPWQEAADRYPPGSTVTGVVEKVEPFGVFVQVEAGISALLPGSESQTGTVQDLRRQYPAGREITATVLNVDPERRRMSLSLKAMEEAQADKALKEFQKQQEKTSSGQVFGTLGDLFADKLKR